MHLAGKIFGGRVGILDSLRESFSVNVVGKDLDFSGQVFHLFEILCDQVYLEGGYALRETDYIGGVEKYQRILLILGEDQAVPSVSPHFLAVLQEVGCDCWISHLAFEVMAFWFRVRLNLSRGNLLEPALKICLCELELLWIGQNILVLGVEAC